MAFGDQKPATDRGGSAKGILTQIKGLLHQYLDLGDATPLKSEADSFLNQVEDGLDRLDADSASESPAEDTSEGGEHAEESGDQPGSSKPTSFRDATKAARDAGVMGPESPSPHHGGTKTQSDGSAEQSQEEDPKRKKGSKAGNPFG